MAAARDRRLRAGAAQVDITPEAGVRTGGTVLAAAGAVEGDPSPRDSAVAMIAAGGWR